METVMETERILRLLAEGRLTPAQVAKAATLGLVAPEASPGTNVAATQANLATLRTQATAAFGANRAFVALAAPTNAQTLAQVKALSRQINGVMRLLLNQLDGTD